MIKVTTAYTLEPNDTDYAVREVLTQLGDNLSPNSIGLLFCNLEFIDSALVRELCARLPFNVVGCTSQGFAVKDAGEEFMLTLMVLSGDDVQFSSGVSASLAVGGEGAIESLYRDLLAEGENNSAEDPVLIFAFTPMFANTAGMTGNAMVHTLDRVSGGVPIFGSVALDIIIEQRSPMTIFNGECYSDRMPLVLVRGNVKPRFLACSLPRNVQINQTVTITEAKGNRLISIDNIPAGIFMEKIGLLNQGSIDVIYAFPIVVDYHDGSESRAFAITKIDPDGALVSEQDIPVGGTVTIGPVDEKLVLESTRHFIDRIKEASVQNGLLIASCISRVFTFQDSMGEIKLIQQQMHDMPAPFLYIYSGGEICPFYKPGKDKPINAFHQFTIVACII